MKTFNRYKVNCSELGELMGNEKYFKPVTDADWNEFNRILSKGPNYITERQAQVLKHHIFKVNESENPPVSTTAKKNMYKHYAYARFGASKVSLGGKQPLQLQKGNDGEADAISFLSKIDGITYQKNQKMVSNSYFKGVPDILIYEGEKIVGIKEIKAPLDLISYLERVDGDYTTDDQWELLAYLDILGLPSGELCYVLVDMPQNIQDAKIKEAKEKYESFGYDKEHVRRRVKNLERSMNYGYIPEHLRIQRFQISRKGFFTRQMHSRVKNIRGMLTNLHNKFENGLLLP